MTWINSALDFGRIALFRVYAAHRAIAFRQLRGAQKAPSVTQASKPQNTIQAIDFKIFSEQRFDRSSTLFTATRVVGFQGTLLRAALHAIDK